jgi:hypothetical protein
VVLAAEGRCLTMVAVSANGTSSLIELGAARIGQAMAARRAKRQGRSGIFAFIGEVLGTVLAMAAFTVAAFAVGFVLGMCVTGVAVLLLDFKVSMVRRARATQQPSRR